MYNKEETMRLLGLKERLLSERDTVGWLATLYKGKVQYPNNSEASKNIQSQVNSVSNLMLLTYVWAILEEQGFSEHNVWLTDHETLELKAWKHIRHSAAHAPSGRARRYYQEFEQYMDSPLPTTSGLKQNCSYDADAIDCKDGMGYRFYEYSAYLIDQVIGLCANNPRPSNST